MIISLDDRETRTFYLACMRAQCFLESQLLHDGSPQKRRDYLEKEWGDLERISRKIQENMA